MFTAVSKSIAITAVQDIFEVAAPADSIVIIHSWIISQSTDYGDSEEEGLVLTTNRGVGTVTSGSGGSTVTTQPIQDGQASAGSTVERNNTTAMAAGSGSIEELEAIVWNVRVPFERIYAPEYRPIIGPSQHWTLELETAPADSITVSATLVFEEIGS